jgi:hypothetical protein
MRKQTLILLTLLTLAGAGAWAQSPVRNRISSGIDAGAGFKRDNISPSIQYYQVLHLIPNRLFSVGWTVRYTGFYGTDLEYITAPARLSRGKTGFEAIGAPYVPANLDTLSYTHVSAHALNFGLRVQGRIGPVEIGASADLFGLSIGPGGTAKYQSSTGQFVAGTSVAGKDSLASFTGTNASQAANPTPVNLRLLGDNNIGTLATEVFVRVLVNPRLGVKVGYQWLTTEMTTNNRDLIADNNRFRYSTSMAYVALTFPLF